MRVFVNPHPGTVLPMIFGERGRERDIDVSLSCLLRGPTGWPGDGVRSPGPCPGPGSHLRALVREGGPVP